MNNQMFTLTLPNGLEFVQQIALPSGTRPGFAEHDRRAKQTGVAPPNGCAGMKQRGSGMTTTGVRVIDRDLEAAFDELTPTQMKVLEGVNSGRLNKQIAFDLGIAEATVKAHMTALMRKLNVHNRTQAAIAAQALAHWPRSAAR
ncbi:MULTISPECIES: helix-turn-helix domain-containing protein [unclassified Caulobacter]|uniref:helix-turn-helix domain-containing protein n=1 Tax=unclassified Caulobacter TaxID=2648921 RepID=UPI001F33071B|nr:MULTISPECIES: LuxR C-terminal-related transcriptional regulator [unclassified Caulobacter]